MKTASWVIREKETGRVVLETFDERVLKLKLKDEYELVPILEHLQSLNHAEATGN